MTALEPMSASHHHQRQAARIFISCGQQKDTAEETIARQLADGLKKLGFEPYIAVAEQTLRGVQENIFRTLSESEYLLFIDFKREKLETGYHRGSLFSHQELALATYLDIPMLGFREDGVVPEDGILRFLQANCTPFSDRRHLAEVILWKIENQSGWVSHWRNGLSLERPEPPFEDTSSARFFHITVRNLHRTQIARDCIAYLTRIYDHSTDQSRTLELYEFKWKGVKTASVAIPPQTARYLDAFRVYWHDPATAWLGINGEIVDRYSTFGDYTLKGSGVFDLHFLVFSANLPVGEAVFRLSISSTVNEVRFELL